MERDEFVVILMRPLPAQKLVVAAARLVGILVANTGTGVVDRAASRFRIEEHARAAEDVVLLMPKDALALNGLREAPLGGLVVDAEVFRETGDVALADADAIVRAAVGRSLQTVEQQKHTETKRNRHGLPSW